MPSLKSIKKRIGSVKNTQKITRAMKMVAAAKLRRAQHAAFRSREYTEAIRGLSHRLIASRTTGDPNPLIVPRERVARREYLVLTSDRGLCGGFNGNLLRRLGERLAECKEARNFSPQSGREGGQDRKTPSSGRRETVATASINLPVEGALPAPVTTSPQSGREGEAPPALPVEGATRAPVIETACRVIGKKGRDYFRTKNWPMTESITHIYDTLDRSVSEMLAKVAIHRFESGKTDEVWVVYNLFRSALVQEVTFQPVLPLPPGSIHAHKKKEEASIDYIFEPAAEEVLDKALRETVVAQIHQAFLESIACELAARMTAMESATSNASDMIGYLTLQYNRARQASITRELMDIVNGAEALR